MDRVTHIKSCFRRVFPSAPDRAVSALAEVRHALREHRAGETLRFHGRRGGGQVVLIDSGRLETRMMRGARPFVIRTHREGDMLGLYADIDRAACIAVEATMAVWMPCEPFHAVLFAHRCLMEAVLAQQQRCQQETDARLVEFAYLRARERVWAELARRWTLAGRSPRDGMRFSKQELAAHVGVSRETVVRMCTDFEREGSLRKLGYMTYALIGPSAARKA